MLGLRTSEGLGFEELDRASVDLHEATSAFAVSNGDSGFLYL